MKIKKRNNIIYYLTIAVIILGSIEVSGQSILENYIEEGLKANQQFLKQQLSTQASFQDKEIAKSQFYPNIFLDANYSVSNGGRTIDIPLGDLFNPIHSSLNDINGNNEFPTDINNVSEQFLPNDFHDTRIRIIQPLLNSSIYYQYKEAKSNLSANSAKEEAFKNQLKFEITKAYYNYLKALDQKKILDSTKVIIQDLERVNSKFVKYDLATKDVVYNSKSQLFEVEAQLASASREIMTSRMFFNMLLNRNLNDSIVTEQVNNIAHSYSASQNLEELAINNRSEVRELETTIEALGYRLKKDKNFLIPNITAMGDFGYQGYGYQFDKKQEYFFVNINLTWPIFQGNKNRSTYKKTQLIKNQSEYDLQDLINSIKLQVNTAILQLIEAIKVHEAQVSNLESAGESFKIIKSRYIQHLIPLVEFNEARINYTNAQIKVSIAKYNIKIAEANLNRTLQL